MYFLLTPAIFVRVLFYVGIVGQLNEYRTVRLLGLSSLVISLKFSRDYRLANLSTLAKISVHSENILTKYFSALFVIKIKFFQSTHHQS